MDLLNPELHPLLRPLRRNLEQALYVHARAGLHELAQRRHGGVDDDLKVRRTGPVIEFKESKRTLALLPTGLDPTPDLYGLTGEASAAVGSGENGADQDTVGELGLDEGSGNVVV